MVQQRCVVHVLGEDESIELTIPGGDGVDKQQVVVTLGKRSGRRARLRIMAPDDVQISRQPSPGKRTST